MKLLPRRSSRSWRSASTGSCSPVRLLSPWRSAAARLDVAREVLAELRESDVEAAAYAETLLRTSPLKDARAAAAGRAGRRCAGRCGATAVVRRWPREREPDAGRPRRAAARAASAGGRLRSPAGAERGRLARSTRTGCELSLPRRPVRVRGVAGRAGGRRRTTVVYREQSDGRTRVLKTTADLRGCRAGADRLRRRATFRWWRKRVRHECPGPRRRSVDGRRRQR